MNRKLLPIQLTQVLEPLEQPAVDKDAVAVVCQEMFRPGYGSCCAE